MERKMFYILAIAIVFIMMVWALATSPNSKDYITINAAYMECTYNDGKLMVKGSCKFVDDVLYAKKIKERTFKNEMAG